MWGDSSKKDLWELWDWFNLQTQRQSPTCPQINQCHSRHENQRVPKRLCLGCWKPSQLQKLWRAPEKNGPVMTTVLLYKHRNQQVRTRSIFPISASRNPARVLLVFQWQADKGKTEREREPVERQGKRKHMNSIKVPFAQNNSYAEFSL